MKTLFMETTEISAEKTVHEIQACLGKYGADGVQLEYKDGEVHAVSFGIRLRTGEKPLFFALPARWEPIMTIMRARYSHTPSNAQGDRMKAQAKRVAWRQILRWVQAQMAMVETNMVRIEEVFMPYLVVHPSGQTLFQKLQENQFQIEAPKK